jgi:hypothetical protein
VARRLPLFSNANAKGKISFVRQSQIAFVCRGLRAFQKIFTALKRSFFLFPFAHLIKISPDV